SHHYTIANVAVLWSPCPSRHEHSILQDGFHVRRERAGDLVVAIEYIPHRCVAPGRAATPVEGFQLPPQLCRGPFCRHGIADMDDRMTELGEQGIGLMPTGFTAHCTVY